jgi:hypothetical protein
VSPILLGLVVAGLHFAGTLAVIVVGTGPLFRRMEAGLPRTRYDRGLQAVLRVLSFPVHPVTSRYPGLLRTTGWPREHVLLVANSGVWGIGAGLLGLVF